MLRLDDWKVCVRSVAGRSRRCPNDRGRERQPGGAGEARHHRRPGGICVDTLRRTVADRQHTDADALAAARRRRRGRRRCRGLRQRHRPDQEGREPVAGRDAAGRLWHATQTRVSVRGYCSG